MSSQILGSSLASFGAFIFLYYSTWIFVTVTIMQPFMNQDHWVQNYFLDRTWAVRIPKALLIAGISAIVLLISLHFILVKLQKKLR